MTGGDIDAGNAGTVGRFLPAVAALAIGIVRFAGDPRMAERPVGPLVATLRALGVAVSGDAIPFAVHGTGRVAGGAATIDASQSSQFVSGLLLAAPRFDRGLVLRHTGPTLPSRPHLAMTVAMMRSFGATVSDEPVGTWEVMPGGYLATDTDVEPDLSSAAPFLAAAAATAGTVRIPGWPTTTTQPGAILPALLQRMGASWRLDRHGLELTGPDRLIGLDADLADCGELAPVLAALATLATTPSRLTGIAHLRLHETDRLAALARELAALGAVVTELPDGLEITPKALRPTVFQTYDDHRLAMAGAVIGLVVPGVAVENIATTGKTMPDFPERWAAMLR